MQESEAVRFARYSRAETEAAGFMCKKSKVGIRADGSLKFDLKGDDWKMQREAALVRDGRKCLSCGTRDNLDPHHIWHRGDGGGDDLANLRTLCRPCHRARHPEKRIRWTKKTLTSS